MVDRSSVLKLEEIDERAGVDGSVFYLLLPFLDQQTQLRPTKIEPFIRSYLSLKVS